MASRRTEGRLELGPLEDSCVPSAPPATSPPLWGVHYPRRLEEKVGPGQSGRESLSLHPTCPLPGGVGTPLAPVLPGGGSPEQWDRVLPLAVPL